MVMGLLLLLVMLLLMLGVVGMVVVKLLGVVVRLEAIRLVLTELLLMGPLAGTESHGGGVTRYHLR